MATLVKGTIITMDDAMPEAKYMLVEDGKISKVSQEAIDAPDAELIETTGYVFPGLIEPHGHPMDCAVELSKDVVDIRPVIIDNAKGVIKAIEDRLATLKAGQPLFINGWDPLVQKGLPVPHIDYLDKLAPNNPITILHNSGHAVYFNTAMAKLAGVSDDTPDPVGGQWIKENGKLTGEGHEGACAMIILKPILDGLQANSVEYMETYCKEMNALGITTCANLTAGQMSDGVYMAALKAGVMSLRIRAYQMTTEADTTSKVPEDKNGMYKQLGVKIWSDGSPWVGNIYTSFPYLTNDATKSIGLEPGHKGKPNYTAAQLLKICDPLAKEGMQFACHSHGDLAIDETLDVYETLIKKYNIKDARFRVEHCGAMTPEQFERAAKLGCTIGLFVDHIYYWGDIMVNELFGEERGGAWANAGAAEEAGCSVTYHNDGAVTPTEPFRNMQVAQDRTSKYGLVLKAGKPASREQALKAHTSEAAYQLKAENDLGSLSEGKYADFIVLDQDPRTIKVADFTKLKVKETYLAGEKVFEATKSKKSI
ncbi:MAG: amidohydrolase [Micrococcaceae bacterium]